MADRAERLERQKRIRAKIKAQTFVRKVWLLPGEMTSRIVDYQEERLLPSEVDAARELLNSALIERGFR